MRSRSVACRISQFALGWGLAATAALAVPLPPLSLVSDLAPGEEAVDRGYVAPLARLGNALLAQGTDPLHGAELWRYGLDGSGGERLADLCPGLCGSAPQNGVVLGDHLLFVATDTSHGTELWTTDGTAAGTHLVRDLCPGPCSGLAVGAGGGPSAPVVVGNQLFFAADDGLSGAELWKSDGTFAGTVQVADVRPGANGSQPSQLVAFRGLAYFFANGGTGGSAFWQSDGSAAGTVRLSDPCSSNCPGHLIGASADWLLLETAPCLSGVPAASNLFALDRAGQIHALPVCTQGSTAAFAGAGAFVVGTSPPRLWHVDLAHGTVVDLGQGRFTSASNGRLAGNLFFFVGVDAQGAEPWVSDGTPAGTRRLDDINPGPGGSFPMSQATALGNRLIFSVELATGRSLWVSDGTPDGTRPLSSGAGVSDPQAFANAGSYALFVGTTAGEKGLWRTDGTSAGTVRVESLTTPHGRSTTFYPVSAWDDRAFWFTPHFPQTTPPFTEEVWISDGTAAATRVLTPPGAGASIRFQGIPLAGHLYIAGIDSVLVSDGSSAAAVSVLPGSYDAPQELAVAGSRLYFLARSPAGDDGLPALFAYDPGSLAAVEVTKLTFPADLTAVGDRLYFTDDDPALGRELFTAQGLEAARVADLCPGSCSSSPHTLTPFGGRLLFLTFGAGAARGVTLWITDGTAAGTRPLRTFPAGDLADAVVSPRELALLGNRMYFLTGTAAGDELWSTDGTAAGTVRVLAFSGFGGFSQSGEIVTARHLTAVGARLFLAVDTPSTGEEPWVSDGTAAGTRLVADLRPGPESSAPRELAAVGNRVVFAADDGLSGLELWASTGTAGGTFLVGDVAAGPDSSSPDEITVTSDRIFFTADDGLHGRELWSLAREAVSTYTCRPSATTLCLGDGRFAVTATWRTPPNADPPGQFPAQTVPAITTDQTGGFWFFDPGNTELLVKILDGGVVNDHFWVFYGALSDVAYEIEVRDLATGLVRLYSNPAGTLCGQADVSAFPHASAAAAPPSTPAALPAAAVPPSDICHPADPSGLCLGPNGRFFVRVAVIPPGARDPVFATPLTGTSDTGFFWFFDPANLELAVKVLDGTAVNGHFWVFYGALTDVRYIVTVFDTRTGAVKNYNNPQGQLCGQADVAAF